MIKSFTPMNPKKYSCYGPEKIHTRNMLTKKIQLKIQKENLKKINLDIIYVTFTQGLLVKQVILLLIS